MATFGFGLAVWLNLSHEMHPCFKDLAEIEKKKLDQPRGELGGFILRRNRHQICLNSKLDGLSIRLDPSVATWMRV